MTHHTFTHNGAMKPARLAAPLLVATAALILALSFAGQSVATRTAASGTSADEVATRLIAQPMQFPARS